ncbi:MAG TPA: DNA-binding domain-containing protein [Methyloceanibacter sp.]
MRAASRECLGPQASRPRNDQPQRAAGKLPARILAGDDSILSEIKDSPKEERKVLFGVYRNAYVARLAEVLADDYEQVHAYLGDAGFAKLAKSYIAAHPSDRRSARDFGRHVPDFLKTDPGFAAHAEVAEIAALEKALADAFDGPEAEPLSLTTLAKVAPELWTKLVFTPHPTAHRLTFATNAADIWSALHTRALRRRCAACLSRKRSSSGGRM